MEIEEHDQLVSFDVVSLFTQVSIDEILAVVAQRLEEDYTLLERTPYPSEDIHALDEICLNTMYFQLSIPR